MTYGEWPYVVTDFQFDEWTEMFRYLYLPVRMAGGRPRGSDIRLPRRLRFLHDAVETALQDALKVHPDPYVYVTAKRGYATPANPLNRPGWHCDGFGSDDLNYVWWDKWPTRFACQKFEDIPDDHVASMRELEAQIDSDKVVTNLPCRVLYRLTPFVVHTTPLMETGGMRSFLKISVSPHRYNLEGNSHNHNFDYDWKMWPREIVRNDPVHADQDFYLEEHHGEATSGHL